MARSGVSRREFLRQAGGAAGAAAVGLTAWQASGAAAPHEEPVAQAVHEHEGVHAAQALPQGPRSGVFFNRSQWETVDAIAERLMPGDIGKAGARDADVINYIDLALAGAYSDQQDFYRRGLTALENYCQETHGKSFRALGPSEQDAVITAMERGEATGFTWPTSQQFFNTLRIHTIEGMFSDPVYGGNKDFSGWRLIEFPGAQHFYLPADLLSDQKFTRLPVTGLRGPAAQGGL